MNTKRIAGVATLVLALGCMQASSADTPQPVKISKDQIQGNIFKDYKPVVEETKSERGPYTTKDVEAFLSSDKHFDAGMYSAGPNRFTISEPYGVDEFMYFLKGGVTLTSEDGTVLEINAGDAVIIPKEWQGVWDTDGYTKIYVIYSPDEPIE